MSDLIGQRVAVPNATGYGYIRYLGPIQYKTGLFAGLELQGSLAKSRGRNSGSVDGVSYFTVSVPKSGLFLPYDRLKSVNPQLPDVSEIGNGHNGGSGATDLVTPIRPNPRSRFSPMSKPPYQSAQRNTRIPHQQNGEMHHYSNTDHNRRESSWSMDQHQSEMSTTPLRSPLTPSNTYHDAKLNLLDDQLHKSENGHNYKEQIEELNKLIREKDRKLENFKKQREEWHSAMDDLIAVQQDGITVFEEKIQELEDVNSNSKAEIDRLLQKLKDSNAKVDQLEKECSELRLQSTTNKPSEDTEAKIHSLETTCKNYSDQVKQLQKDLNAANEQIEQLKKSDNGRTTRQPSRNHSSDVITVSKRKDSGSENHSSDAIAALDRLISLSTVSSTFAEPNDATKAMHSSNSLDDLQDLPVYKPSSLTDPSAGRSDWCGLCERDGHSSINCPFEKDIF
ncbi:hypothetical protein I9W82_001387 [Candida metapsilosis]|uniref:CAP-Gly domain-containing protein n=1 Tax=Candida metapsilosis TaxID=273372 RepID=A0A8H7ZHS1_9ASCO|nr:hypothetical protein I9W82_001387 [Candida metapsilosis]